MTHKLMMSSLLAATVVAMLLALAAVAAPPYQVPLTGAREPAVTRTSGFQAPVSDSAIDLVAARAAFRGSRTPAPVRYSAEGNAAGPIVEPPRVPRPVLSLSGIVWEPEPRAVVEGIPGVEGAKVLQRGDTAGGLRVARIERARVIITGLDTTWSLSMKEPWK
jgi:hypothetical protein